MMTWIQKQKHILVHIMWFVASLLMATIVWITANLDTDPFLQRGFRESIPVQIRVPEGVIITNTPTSRAFVVLRTQESVFEQLAVDDIQVFADLENVTTTGRVTVPLQAHVAEERRASVVTISPSQITVELEQREERLVPLDLTITGELPISVEADTPATNITQVLVSGPASAVSQVSLARVSIDLSDQRQSLDLELRPEALNVEGQVIEGVTLSPDTIGVTVQIEPRSDVREVRVTPNIIGEPPDGYTLTPNFDYLPETVFVSGPPSVLENLPGTFLTAPIDLSAYTNDFQVRVPVELPDENLVLITGQRITVSVGIDPIQSSRQFEGIPVEVVNLQEGLTATPAPEVVTVLINGPQPVLTELAASNLRVVVDANAIVDAGTIQLQPSATLTNAQLEIENISVLPPTIDVIFASLNEDG